MMDFLANFLQQTGVASLDLFWFPLLIWSICAVIIHSGLRKVQSVHPLYQYQLHIALVATIPLGMTAAVLAPRIPFISTPGSSSSRPFKKSLFLCLALLVIISGLIGCSHLQKTSGNEIGLTNARTAYQYQLPTAQRNSDSFKYLNPPAQEKKGTQQETTNQVPNSAGNQEQKNKGPAESQSIQQQQLLKLKRSFQRCIRYPDEARKTGTEGWVIAQFIVNTDGRVEKPKIIRGIDQEVLRCIKIAEFEPALHDNKPVQLQVSMPLLFDLAEFGKSYSTSRDSLGVGAKTGHIIPAVTVVGYGGF